MRIVNALAALFLSLGLILSPSYAQESENSALQSQDEKTPAESEKGEPASVEPAVATVEKVEVSEDTLKAELASYSYSLKQLIEMANKNIQKVDAELKQQEVLRQNQERELEAKIYFEKGNELHEAGRLEEAKEQWQQALKITQDPRMRNYVQESERLAIQKRVKEQEALREKIDALYAEAVSQFNIDNLDDSQKIFEDIISLDANNARAKRYLNINIPNKKRQLADEAKRRQEETARAQALEKQRQARAKQDKLNQDAEKLYSEAISLYRAEDYDKAIEQFKQADKLIPGYKKSSYYIEQIPKDIERKAEISEQNAEKQAIKEKVDTLYGQAVACYNNGKLSDASAKFNELLALDSKNIKAKNYAEVRIPRREKELALEKQREQDKAERVKLDAEKQAKQMEQEKKEKEAQAFYCQGIRLYRDEKYDEACAQFKAAKGIIPNYGKVNYYIDRIEDIKKSPKEKK